MTNEETKIPTAEEFLSDEHQLSGYDMSNLGVWEEVNKAMIEFARLHVEVALKSAYQNAELKEEEPGDEQICFMANDMGDVYVLDKNSIVNSYPLENIK